MAEMAESNGDKEKDRKDAQDGTDEQKDAGDTIDPPAGSDNGDKPG